MTFNIQETKFDFFFGRVTSSPKNQKRSSDNLRDLNSLGIQEENNGRAQLLELFETGLRIGEEVSRRPDKYGVTIRRSVLVETNTVKGAIHIFYLYRGGDLTSIPEVTSL